MTDSEAAEGGTASGTDLPLDRRTVLKTTGALAALSAGVGLASAQGDGGGDGAAGGDGSAPESGAGGRPPAGTWPATDPVFGLPATGPNPCGGGAGTDCFEAFQPPVRPATAVEMHTDLPELLLAVAGADLLSGETIAGINEAAADGSVEGDDDLLGDPDASLSVPLPGGGTEERTVRDVATALAGTAGFHYDPAGIRVEPGDVVLFGAEAPDHAVAAYHERHGRQNRVPDGIGPIASPLVPVGGYWLYHFPVEGVYDLYCPPHQTFGMAMRVVVYGGDDAENGDDGMDDAGTDGNGGDGDSDGSDGDSHGAGIPAPSIEQTGRPPQAENAIAGILGGLDPNLPSSIEVLESDALEPATVVESGRVSWETVVAEHRG